MWCTYSYETLDVVHVFIRTFDVVHLLSCSADYRATRPSMWCTYSSRVRLMQRGVSRLIIPELTERFCKVC